MKGIVFREFITLVENVFGEEMMDTLILATNPNSGGSYTSVGTYDHQELIGMVTELSKQTGIPASELIHTFGKTLADVFSRKFPLFFQECKGTVDFLKKIDNHIHVEVIKLYPDAELPKFSYTEISESVFKLKYESTRDFSYLAQGLIEGCMEYFGESYQLFREDIETPSNTQVIFTLNRFIK